MKKAASKKVGYCRRGHLVSPENLMVLQNGKTRCRQCHKEDSLRWYYRNQLERKGLEVPHELKKRPTRGTYQPDIRARPRYTEED